MSDTALLLLDYQVALCDAGPNGRQPALAAQVEERQVLQHAARALDVTRAAGRRVITCAWPSIPPTNCGRTARPGSTPTGPSAPCCSARPRHSSWRPWPRSPTSQSSPKGVSTHSSAPHCSRCCSACASTTSCSAGWRPTLSSSPPPAMPPTSAFSHRARGPLRLLSAGAARLRHRQPLPPVLDPDLEYRVLRPEFFDLSS